VAERSDDTALGTCPTTTKAAWRLASRRSPNDEVYAMLYEGKDVRQAVQDLTARESKAED
jgi:glycerol-3-phosphate dehydrogenase